MPVVQAEPINANGEPDRLIQPRRAAQATTAGAVNDRKPAMIPIQNARRSVTPELLEFDPPPISRVDDCNSDAADYKTRCSAAGAAKIGALPLCSQNLATVCVFIAAVSAVIVAL